MKAQLLEFSVAQGWRPLCDFLEVATSDCPDAHGASAAQCMRCAVQSFNRLMFLMVPWCRSMLQIVVRGMANTTPCERGRTWSEHHCWHTLCTWYCSSISYASQSVDFRCAMWCACSTLQVSRSPTSTSATPLASSTLCKSVCVRIRAQSLFAGTTRAHCSYMLVDCARAIGNFRVVDCWLLVLSRRSCCGVANVQQYHCRVFCCLTNLNDAGLE